MFYSKCNVLFTCNCIKFIIMPRDTTSRLIHAVVLSYHRNSNVKNFQRSVKMYMSPVCRTLVANTSHLCITFIDVKEAYGISHIQCIVMLYY